MRIPVLAAVVVVSVLAYPASAGPKVSPKEQKIRKLLELTGGEDLAKQVLDHTMAQFRQMPNLPPGFADKFHELAKKEDIVSMYVPIYMRHLEEKDVDAAIRFFSSPAGRSFVKAQPAIVQESMAAGQKWGETLARRAMAELEAEKQKSRP